MNLRVVTNGRKFKVQNGRERTDVHPYRDGSYPIEWNDCPVKVYTIYGSIVQSSDIFDTEDEALALVDVMHQDWKDREGPWRPLKNQ